MPRLPAIFIVRGNWLEIESVDMLGQTPLLVIMPYAPDYNPRRYARTIWYKQRSPT